MDAVCVMGLGYIGLPTAALFASHGLRVYGVDVEEGVVETLRAGKPYIHEPDLSDVVKKVIADGSLSVDTTPHAADAFVLAVPTPIMEDNKADLRHVCSATEMIIPYLAEGNLVVLESTSPPRTTTDVVKPILEQSGLKVGRDLLLAYAPERVLPGRILTEMVNNARVVGGVDEASALAGKEFYRSFVKGEIVTTDATCAEMVKLMENTYRDVNIAIANEFSRLAQQFGVNVWEAIEVANLHPRVQILRPGPGVGGHCISVDPWFLVEAAPETARLIRQAREVNDSQPGFVVELLERQLGDLEGKTITCLGMTYKANVDDIREAPSLEVVSELQARGAIVRAYDPYVSADRLPVALDDSLDAALDSADAVVLLVPHDEFVAAQPGPIRSGTLLLDTCHVLDVALWEASGYKVLLLGDGKGRIS